MYNMPDGYIETRAKAHVLCYCCGMEMRPDEKYTCEFDGKPFHAECLQSIAADMTPQEFIDSFDIPEWSWDYD